MPVFWPRGHQVYRAEKPDLAAPGVGIMAPDRDGGYSPVTGTSFAAPLVTGAAALLMEWGIVRENDPYLYGEKVKAYLRKGARRLPSELAIRIRGWDMERSAWRTVCRNNL